jgi:hypothetical protein
MTAAEARVWSPERREPLPSLPESARDLEVLLVLHESP